jgi:hypothetical protein
MLDQAEMACRLQKHSSLIYLLGSDWEKWKNLNGFYSFIEKMFSSLSLWTKLECFQPRLMFAKDKEEFTQVEHFTCLL